MIRVGLTVLILLAAFGLWRFGLPLERHFLEYCTYLARDGHKIHEQRCHTVALTSLIAVTLLWSKASRWSWGLYLGMVIVLYVIPYVRLLHDFSQLVHQLRYQFPLWLRQLQVLLYGNTVANALILSIQRAPTLLRNDLHDLAARLEQNPLDYLAYSNFLARFQIIEVQRTMQLLYRINFVGNDTMSEQFQRLLQTSAVWLRSERKLRFADEHALYQWWGMVPLLAVSLAFLVLMFVMMILMLERR